MGTQKRDGTFAARVIARDKCCQECGAIKNLCAHHIIPISLGGTDDPSNGMALCPSCHADKHPSVPRGLFFTKANGNADTTKWNATSLAAEFGYCARTIIRAAKRLGIERSNGSRWAFTEAEKEEIIENIRNRPKPKRVHTRGDSVTRPAIKFVDRIGDYMTVERVQADPRIPYTAQQLRTLARSKQITARKVGTMRRSPWLLHLPSLLEYIAERQRQEEGGTNESDRGRTS